MLAAEVLLMIVPVSWIEVVARGARVRPKPSIGPTASGRQLGAEARQEESDVPTSPINRAMKLTWPSSIPRLEGLGIVESVTS